MPKFVNTWTEEEEAEWKLRLLAGAEIVGAERDADTWYWGAPKGAAEVPTMGPEEIAQWAIEVVKPLPEIEHGKSSLHAAQQCRCELCNAQMREYRRKRREAASAPTALTA